jgi:hypothetical protein
VALRPYRPSGWRHHRPRGRHLDGVCRRLTRRPGRPATRAPRVEHPVAIPVPRPMGHRVVRLRVGRPLGRTARTPRLLGSCAGEAPLETPLRRDGAGRDRMLGLGHGVDCRRGDGRTPPCGTLLTRPRRRLRLLAGERVPVVLPGHVDRRVAHEARQRVQRDARRDEAAVEVAPWRITREMPSVRSSTRAISRGTLARGFQPRLSRSVSRGTAGNDGSPAAAWLRRVPPRGFEPRFPP